MAKKKVSASNSIPGLKTRPAPTAKSREITFHYIKNHSFRTIDVATVQGGLTPNGRKIQANICSERMPIPIAESFDIQSNGRIGKLKKKIGRVGVVREVETSLVMELSVAKALHQWLSEHIGILENEINAQGSK